MKDGIYFGDCLDYLKNDFEDNSIDLTITDPPYGIDYVSSWKIYTKQKPKIENDKSPFIDWIEPLYNKLKTGGRLICFYRWDVQDSFLNEIK